MYNYMCVILKGGGHVHAFLALMLSLIILIFIKVVKISCKHMYSKMCQHLHCNGFYRLWYCITGDTDNETQGVLLCKQFCERRCNLNDLAMHSDAKR